jgi:predicted molibdopterin-dependent oxidoreductase YjgC
MTALLSALALSVLLVYMLLVALFESWLHPLAIMFSLPVSLIGAFSALWVFGHDLVKLFGEERVRQLSERVPLFVYSGTNENLTVPWAHWVLPSAAYVEKDGTFVNCHGWIQRVGRAFPTLGDSREDWRTLLELAGKLGRPLDWQGPREIFRALAEAVAPFEGLSYETIGAQGARVALPKPAAGGTAP